MSRFRQCHASSCEIGDSREWRLNKTLKWDPGWVRHASPGREPWGMCLHGYKPCRGGAGCFALVGLAFHIRQFPGLTPHKR